MDDRAWGIDAGHESVDGRWHEADAATLSAIRVAMGATEGAPPRLFGSDPAGEWILALEDGETVDGAGALPPDLPLGYHRLLDDDGERLLIVAPLRCPVPSTPGWGWATQLYALRSRQSWGIGDLADLRALGEWSRAAGAAVTLVSPLHAPSPGPPQQPSPYYPSSRRARNLLHLRIEDVPGAGEVADELDPLAAAGRALNADRLIDREAVYRLKRAALERIWRAGAAPARDRALTGWATFCAIAEILDEADFRRWPAEYRHPGSAAVTRLVAEPAVAELVAFHGWVQSLIDDQVAAANAVVPLINDVAVGVDPAGADAWLWQDAFAPGMRVGAPPDEFNDEGQDWGLPPFDPWQLRAAGYEPFIQAVRAALRGAGGLRLDHVMGLFRLWWIPDGMSPTEGAYVRYPSRDLLDIVALEAHRGGASWVVGEDLGTVEDGVREELERRGVLSYRLLWFEDGPTREWPVSAVAAVTTHDLPTIAGAWSGADPDAGPMRARLQRAAGLSDGAAVDEAVLGAHRALADAPSVLITATIDDALEVMERPNHPGTTDEFPNWSVALPLALEEIVDDPRLAATAAILSSRS